MNINNKQLRYIAVTLLLSLSYGAQAQDNVVNNGSEARAKYEEQKDNITYASNYIKEDTIESENNLLTTEIKKDDSLSINNK
ncbi:hypothetical protein [Vibrio sp. YIC-376]|uniref:hypothetical protein n=1 Tax=Vibrio sp. YIC-376 TaxID=3136162 RepID=UPI00402A6BB7